MIKNFHELFFFFTLHTSFQMDLVFQISVNGWQSNILKQNFELTTVKNTANNDPHLILLLLRSNKRMSID